MSNLDHYHQRRQHAGVADPLAACPESRLVARPVGSGPFADDVDALIAQSTPGASAQVLDYGCGSGQDTHRLARVAGGTALGVDPSLPLIREATASDRTRFAHTPDGRVPAGRHRFDAVHVSLVLGGLRGQRLRRAVAELRRVLKPGGLLILIDTTGEPADGPGWTHRPDAAYRALFPEVDLTARGRLTRGSDRLTLLAGPAAASSPGPAAPD